MVSSVRLKKTLRLALGISCMALSIAWAVRTFFRPAARPPRLWENLPEVERDEIPGHPDPETLGPYLGKPIGKAEEDKLKEFFARLTESYANGYYEVVARQIDDVPDELLIATKPLFDHLVTPLRNRFHRFLWEGGNVDAARLAGLLDFEGVEDFSIYMRAQIKVALFLGRSCVKRKEWSVFLKDLEDLILEKLVKYRKKFGEEGRKELVQVVDRFIDEWHDQIDSENGFTRRYMWSVVDDYLRLREEEHRKLVMRKSAVDTWLSRGQIFQIARGAAYYLLKNYTPKWMDEFYDADYLALKPIYADIESAYTNNQTRMLHQSVSRVSNLLGRDYGRPYLDLDEALRRLFEEKFVGQKSLRRFETLGEFERFASVNVEMALFLCSSEFRSGTDVTFRMCDLESQTFRVLRDYVDKFHGEGKRDFEGAAQRHLDAWIAHIESRQSFSYKMASYWWSISHNFAHDVHFGIDGLIKLGYTPKWLDEFK